MSHNYALCHLEAAFAATLQVKLRRCVALTLPVPLPRAGALWGEMVSDLLIEGNLLFRDRAGLTPTPFRVDVPINARDKRVLFLLFLI
jgi:hypothetical protein